MEITHKYTIAIIIVMLSFLDVKAQSGSYVSRSLTGNPKTGTSTQNTEADNTITGWAKVAGIVAPASVNVWSSTINLPFAFKFFGESVTNCKVSMNGLLTFNTTVTSVPSIDNENLPSYNLPNKTIACFWDQFTAQAPTGTNDFIYSKTFGTSPNRQFWIKWYSFEMGNASGLAPATDAYFAIVLEESTNYIYLVDMYKGPSSTLSLSATSGLQHSPYTYVKVPSATKLTSGTTSYLNNTTYVLAPSAFSITATSLSYNATDLNYCRKYSVNRKFVLNTPSSCMNTSLKDAKLYAKMTTGDDYIFGQKDVFEDSTGAKITIKGYNSSGTQIFQGEAKLFINQTNVEKILMLDMDKFTFSSVSYSYSSLYSLTVSIDNYVQSSNNNVKNSLSLTCWIEAEYKYNVNTSPYEASSMITLNSVGTSSDPVEFSWTSACENVPKYEFQLLRLYNTNKDYEDDNTLASGIIDWEKALKLIIENSETSIQLHLTEGSGYYTWRVRPIGNYYDGDEGNDKNWGVWSSSSFPQDGSYDLSSSVGHGPKLFYYTQFDNQKNWIYKRVFTEDNHIGEGISYANGLGMLKQTQHHLQSNDYIIVNNQLYDYTGRGALQSLSVPLSRNNFSYQNKLLTSDAGSSDLYSTKDFDATTNYLSPSSVNGGELTTYYSNSNTDLTIPNANGYPFSRTLFYADGTNRPKEISLPGSEFRIGSTETGTDRTTKIYYSSVGDDELVRVFGDDAPDATSVIKILQVDPNKVINATYQADDGKTLITCLSDAGDNELMVDIENTSFELNDTIKKNTQASDYSYYKEKEFKLDKATNLWAKYEITPSDIKAECGTYCSTCDYNVYGYIKQDGTVIWDTTLIINAEACTTVNSYNFYHLEMVDAASFIVGRTISINNTEATSGNTYLEIHKDSMASIMDTHLEENFFEMRDLLEQADIDGFYDYLVTKGYATQNQIDKEKDVTIVTSCCTITVPVNKCPPHPCDEGTPDFENLLYSMWEDKYGNAFKNYSLVSSVFEYPDNATINAATITFSLPTSSITVFGGDCGHTVSVRAEYTGADGTTKDFYFSESVSICLDDYAITTDDELAQSVYMEIYNFMENTYGSDTEKWPYQIDYNTNQITFAPTLYTSDSKYFGAIQAKIKASSDNYDIDVSNNEFSYTATGDYPYGIGAFNALVGNMLNDGYPCDTLYNTWYALCSAYESLQFDADGNRNDFNLVESFLESVGRMYADTSKHEYGDDTDPGYLSHAHKYVHYVKGTCPDCEDQYDFANSASWDADIRWETATEKTWEQFISCTESCSSSLESALSDFDISLDCSDDITCVESMLDEIEDSCYSLCEARRKSFKTAIREEYAAAGKSITEDEVSCLTDALIAECESGCGLTIYTNPTDPTKIDSVGNQYEIAALQQSLTYTFDLALPTADSSCESMGYKKILYTDNLRDHIADLLNMYLLDFVAAGNTKLEGDDIYTMFIDAYSEYYNFTFDCTLDLGAGITEYFTVDKNSYFYMSTFGKVMISCTYSNSGDYVIFNFVAAPSSCKKIITCGPLCFKWVEPDLTTTEYTIDIETCEENAAAYLLSVLDEQTSDCKEQYINAIADDYETTCADPSTINDVLSYGYTLGYFQYTLFYYDREGNLVKTIPPKGVMANDAYTRSSKPAHTYASTYEYNSRKQMLAKNTPDGGLTQYWYNDLGQLRFSQNAQQALDKHYSYLKYDDLGRVTESGQASICSSCDITSTSQLEDKTNTQTIPSGGEEQTFTVYGNAASGIAYTNAAGISYSQEYLSNRISYIYNDEDGNTGTTDDQSYYYYSYDPHGNIEWLIQTIPGLGNKQIGFEYDLISGKVTKVKYQEGQEDEYYYKYTYDEDNRITSVSTSRNNVIWDVDATYEYYAYGPMKRTVLGEDRVQGLDYLYTLQGWLKAVNHPELGSGKDVGQDGVASSANQSVAADAFGMIINYYKGDFTRTGSNFNNNVSDGGMLNTLNTAHNNGTDYNSYYNGFISNIVSNNNANVTKNKGLPMAGMYLYDELGRLIQNTTDFYSGPDWNKSSGISSDFYELFEYDANGNITNVTRNGY